MIHTMIENSAPRPQLYQQVRFWQVLAQVSVKKVHMSLDVNTYPFVGSTLLLSYEIFRLKSSALMIKLVKALSPRWMSLLFLLELFNLNLTQVEQTGARPLPWWPCACVSMYSPSPSALFYHLGCSQSIHQPGIDWKTFSTSLRYLEVL